MYNFGLTFLAEKDGLLWGTLCRMGGPAVSDPIRVYYFQKTQKILDQT